MCYFNNMDVAMQENIRPFDKLILIVWSKALIKIMFSGVMTILHVRQLRS